MQAVPIKSVEPNNWGNVFDHLATHASESYDEGKYSIPIKEVKLKNEVML